MWESWWKSYPLSIKFIPTSNLQPLSFIKHNMRKQRGPRCHPPQILPHTQLYWIGTIASQLDPCFEELLVEDQIHILVDAKGFVLLISWKACSCNQILVVLLSDPCNPGVNVNDDFMNGDVLPFTIFNLAGASASNPITLVFIYYQTCCGRILGMGVHQKIWPPLSSRIIHQQMIIIDVGLLIPRSQSVHKKLALITHTWLRSRSVNSPRWRWKVLPSIVANTVHLSGNRFIFTYITSNGINISTNCNKTRTLSSLNHRFQWYPPTVWHVQS